jgi:hypothetical protein
VLLTKVRDERILYVKEMRILRWMCGITRMNIIRNEYIRGSLKVAPVTDKMRCNRIAWYGHRYYNTNLSMGMLCGGFKVT